MCVCPACLPPPAPSRIEWERRLFNGMYDEVRDFDRVKYGGERGAGCPKHTLQRGLAGLVGAPLPVWCVRGWLIVWVGGWLCVWVGA